MRFNTDLAEKGVALILNAMGFDWAHNPNFKETPYRVAKAYKEMLQGTYTTADHIVLFPSTYDGIVNFKAIEATGVCPHHLLPIEYSISFAYIPHGKVLGLSKIPRIIKQLAARAVLQEDLTHDIRSYFVHKLDPTGVAVVVTGIHGCMKYRGIQEVEQVTTSSLYGAFFDKPMAREEFLMLNGIKL